MASEGSEIRAIDARIYACDLDERVGYSQGWIIRRESAVARLVTADGTVGWGEAFAPAAEAADAITALAPRVIGTSVFEPRSLLARVRTGMEPGPAMAAAVAAITTAASDAQATLLDVPLWDLLGGKRAPALRSYASGLWFRPAADYTAHYAEVTRALLAMGFTAVKAKIGVSVPEDLRAVERVLMAAGDSAVMVDANQWYDIATAEEIHAFLASGPVVWFEEPLAPDRLSEYAVLRARGGVAIAGGETMTSLQDARVWLQNGSVDVLQPDLCLAGGPTDAVEIANLAGKSGIIVAPHCYGLGIGLAASLHWASTISSIEGAPVWVEIDTSPNPARDALLADCPWFGNGGVHPSVPDGPGLGVEMDLIERFRVR